MKAVKLYLLVAVTVILMAKGYCIAQPRIQTEKIPVNISVEVKGQIELLYSQDPELRSKAAIRLGGWEQAQCLQYRS